MTLFMIKPELKRLNLKNPLHFLAVGLGSGLSPKAPGTMGTLAAIPLYLLVSGLSTPWFIALLVVGFVAGIRICQSATNAIGMPDHGAIVWDEVIGLWRDHDSGASRLDLGAGRLRAVPVVRCIQALAHLLV